MALDAVFIVNAHDASGLSKINAVNGSGTVIIAPTLAGASVLAIRPSDGHIFAFNGDTRITEYDSNLVFIQTLGSTSVSSPDTFTPQSPTNIGWSRIMIQFANGFVYLGWTRGGGGIAVQKRSQSDFSLLDTWTDFAGSLPLGSIQPRAISLNGDVIYLTDIGFSVLGQNVVSAYTISTGLVTSFASYGTWSGTAGWFVKYIRVSLAGQIIVLYNHHATFDDDSLVIVYDSAGTEIINFPVLVGHISGSDYPTVKFCLDKDDTGIWATGPLGVSPDFWNVYTHYRLSNGSVIETILPSIDAFGEMVAAESVTNPSTLTGIYYIKPGKTNDTYFTDIASSTTIDVKIPDPFADTALLGDE